LPILPRKLFVQPAPKVEATSTTASSTVRVVVADDDPVSQNLMIHLFKSLKAEVKAFPDGEEAYNYFKDHSDEVDIIFLDQNMPRMGGIETAKAIRNLSDKVPIYILSGEQEEELRRKLGDIKVNGILTKPVNLSHLERILNRLR
jgi:CheY-like chemotaxis protein